MNVHNWGVVRAMLNRNWCTQHLRCEASSTNGARARQFALITMGGVLVLCLYSVNTHMTQTAYGQAVAQLATLLVAEPFNASEPERTDDAVQQDTDGSCTHDVLAVRTCWT